MTYFAYEISSDARFASSLEYIRRRISDAGMKCSFSADEARTNLSVQEQQGDVYSLLVDAIAEIVITDCKSFYINEHIKVPIPDLLPRHAFTCALSTFDRDTDKIIAKTIIRLTKVFHLDSFYDFMLGILKNRWDEVCMLANENICYLACKNTFNELLRFLISNIECSAEEAHIIEVGNRLEVCGAELVPIKDIYINESLPANIQIINKLVTIAPKRIFLHTDGGELYNTIKELFGTCVVVN